MTEVPNLENPLARWRDKITVCDSMILHELSREMDTGELSGNRELGRLITVRFGIAEKIGNYKRLKGSPIVDEGRKETYRRQLVEKGATIGLPKELVEGVYEILHDSAVAIQRAPRRRPN